MNSGTDFAGIFRGIVAKAKANQHIDPSDYTNPQDGLLYCGRCNTPKECWVRPGIGGLEDFVAPVMCQCAREREEQEKRAEQMRKDMEAIAKLKHSSLMDERFQDQTFESFKTTKSNARPLRLARRYADGFDEMLQKNQGLLFYGDVGTGKTFTAACIANALLDRKIPVVMTSFVKLLDAVGGFNEDGGKLIARLNRAKLVIIDDLGAERGTDYGLEKVYDIVDSRYRAKLPMLLTTNLELTEMKNTADRRYRRIYDRIFEVCYPVEFAGPSFRKAEAKRRWNSMKAFLEGEDDEQN